MHRDAALIGDKELSLALWTLSSFVASLSGTTGHVAAPVSFQHNFMTGTEPRVDEPANETHTMAPKSNVLLAEILRTRPNTDCKVFFLDLRSLSYEVFS